MHRHGRSKHALLCLASFLCRFLHLSTTYELRNFPFYINVREKRKSNKKKWAVQRHWQHCAQDTGRRQTQQ
jgi:hypothetical protein